VLSVILLFHAFSFPGAILPAQIETGASPVAAAFHYFILGASNKADSRKAANWEDRLPAAKKTVVQGLYF
jgi:hypothetical protein